MNTVHAERQGPRSRPGDAEPAEHVGQFFEDEELALQAADDYVRSGLDDGAAALVIATQTHLRGLEQRWRARGIDVEAAREAGRYVPLDVDDMHARICIDGSPHAELFAGVIEPILLKMLQRFPRVIAFGELTGLLWEQGRHRAAVQLEELWNELSRRHGFSVLCAYRIAGDERPPTAATPAPCDESLQRDIRLDHAVLAHLCIEAALAQRKRQLADVILVDGGRRAIQLSRFLSMLGHELRNPLAPIRHIAEALRLTAGGNAEQERLCGVMDRQVRNIVRLLDDLRDLSRIAQDGLRVRSDLVDIADVLARAVEASRPSLDAQRHSLSVTLPTLPLHVCGDVERLAQALAQLLGNAAKYTPGGGRIELAAEASGPWLELRVRDSGVGMPPELLRRVFEPFVQAERTLEGAPGGLGIGLTLVRSIVEAHGGSVQASSAGAGLGAEFSVRLPLIVERSVEAARVN